MSNSDEKSALIGSPSEAPEHSPIYQERTKTKTFRFILIAFLGFVILNIVISIVIVSVFTALYNKLCALLLVSLLAFAQVEFFLLFFIYRGHLSRAHFWAIFVIGVFVVIEAISTDIIVGTSSYQI